VRGERNEKSCKSCSRSSLLDQFQDRETNHVDGRNSYDLLIYYFHEVQRPLKYAIEDVAGGGGRGWGSRISTSREDELHLRDECGTKHNRQSHAIPRD